MWVQLHLGTSAFRRRYISCRYTALHQILALRSGHRRHRGRAEATTISTKSARKRPPAAQRARGSDHRQHKERLEATTTPLNLGAVTFHRRYIWTPLHLCAVTFGCRYLWAPLHLGTVTCGLCDIVAPEGRPEATTNGTKGVQK